MQVSALGRLHGLYGLEIECAGSSLSCFSHAAKNVIHYGEKPSMRPGETLDAFALGSVGQVPSASSGIT